MSINDIGNVSKPENNPYVYSNAGQVYSKNVSKIKSKEGEILGIDTNDAKDLLKTKIEKFNKFFNGEAKFEIDDEADMLVVKIIDAESKEIIRQIPPETTVKLAKALNDLEGILFDEEA